MAITEAQKRKIEEEEKYRAEMKNKYSPVIGSKSKKNKYAAAFLAIFFGSFGLHKFYLGKVLWGLIYLLFFWAFVPMVLGIIEGIMYLSMSAKSFELKYS